MDDQKISDAVFILGDGRMRLKFPNGYVLSCINTVGAYVSDRYNEERHDAREAYHVSGNVEIAIFDPSGEFVTGKLWKEWYEKDRYYNNVESHVDIKMLVDIMTRLKSYGEQN